MKDDLTEVDSLLQSLAAEKLTPTGAHRTPDELAAYHFHQLSADDEEAIQDHLVTCRACTMSLLDLAELCATEPGARKLPASPETTAASLVTTPNIEATTPAPPPLFQRFTEWFFPRRLLPALVVLSLLLSLSLAAWVVSLKREQQTMLAQLQQKQSAREAETAQQIATLQQQKNEATARADQLAAAEQARRTQQELAEPLLNLPVIDVLPRETRTAGEPVAAIPRSAPRFTLVIPATLTTPKFPDYAIEILSKNGTSVVDKKGLKLTPADSFTIGLSTQLFAAGEYRVNVYGLGRGAKTRVAGGVIRFR